MLLNKHWRAPHQTKHTLPPSSVEYKWYDFSTQLTTGCSNASVALNSRINRTRILVWRGSVLARASPPGHRHLGSTTQGSSPRHHHWGSITRAVSPGQHHLDITTWPSPSRHHHPGIITLPSPPRLHHLGTITKSSHGHHPKSTLAPKQR